MLKNYIVVSLLSSKNSLICISTASSKAFPVSASNYCSLKLRRLPNQLGVNQAVAPVSITVQVWPFTPPPNAPRSKLGTQEVKEGAKSTTQKSQSVNQPGSWKTQEHLLRRSAFVLQQHPRARLQPETQGTSKEDVSPSSVCNKSKHASRESTVYRLFVDPSASIRCFANLVP